MKVDQYSYRLNFCSWKKKAWKKFRLVWGSKVTAITAMITAIIYFRIILHHAVHIYDFHIFITSGYVLLMIYEIIHIWTAEMKWKWRNDRRSESNLCNSVKKPEKNSGLQRRLNPWLRDTGAMLYQLSYEATDVGSRSIVGSYVPVKEMSLMIYEINHIWTAEMK